MGSTTTSAARRPALRLDRNESPFGTSAAVLAAWERQRTADRRKYGLNRYGDFFQTDMLEALERHHGLPVTNWTPISGTEEGGNVLAAALLRSGGELVQSWPIADPISRPARAWRARVRRVPLDRYFRQDIGALARAVGPSTRLVHLQNPHDPTGRSFGESTLRALLAAVAERNPDTYVWIDESHAPYSTRNDFPDSFAILAEDTDDSRLIVSRTLSTAHGVAGAPTGYLGASRRVTEQTEGVTNGFFVPNSYGWANAEAGVSRMGEKALLALLTDDGERHLARVRELNRTARERLVKLLRGHGFRVRPPSDAGFVLPRVPGRYRHGGLGTALRARGVLVRSPAGWGTRYRGMVRISAPSSGELRRLDAELARVLGTERQIGKVLPARSGGRGDRRALLAAVGGALVAAPPLRAVRRSSPATRWNPTDPADPLSLTRRQLMLRAALGAAGSAGLLAALSRPGEALAFPPDSFYDTFNLARMIYHENPVGPSSAALDAVRQVIARGPTAARRLEETDQRDLVNAVLRYNRGRSAAVKKLTPANVMLLMGSAEGLFLAVDALVAGGRLISEWPSYRIIRERTWQGGGTVIDVLLDPATRRPNYPALREALKQHPETRLIHFNVQNNPMGTVLRRAEFDPFARHVFRNHPRTVIIADESDREFMEAGRAVSVPDFPAYVARGDNLIHLQTFSHAFALTGLRVGYLFAPQHLIRRLERKRIPRPVNVFGHAAALASLRDPRPQIARSHKTIDEGRRYLYAELDKLGLQYSRSQGQYLMVDTGRSGTAVWAGLISLGVLTRYGREWGMEGWLRVNPGLPDENERFIAALRTVLNEPDPGNLPDPPFPIDDLLPGGNRAIAADLERRLRRDSWLATRLPGFEGPIRVTPAAALGTSRR